MTFFATKKSEWTLLHSDNVVGGDGFESRAGGFILRYTKSSCPFPIPLVPTVSDIF